ncbi:hypothetical protein KXW47_005355, partial [Aspergillus fumigatus]
MAGNQQIDRTFVVRRALSGMPLGRDIVAHSGLLLLTQDSNYYLIERLVGNEEVGFREVDIFVDKVYSTHQVIVMNGLKWTKQLRGEAVLRVCTVDEARTFFETHIREIKYDPQDNNCHSAQEHLRRWLGQSVSEDRPFTKATKKFASWFPTSL